MADRDRPPDPRDPRYERLERFVRDQEAIEQDTPRRRAENEAAAWRRYARLLEGSVPQRRDEEHDVARFRAETERDAVWGYARKLERFVRGQLEHLRTMRDAAAEANRGPEALSVEQVEQFRRDVQSWLAQGSGITKARRHWAGKYGISFSTARRYTKHL